jgi:ABC-2 type transport system permease protein
MSRHGWWTGTSRVSGRALREGLSSRTWRVVTGVMLLLGLAVIVVPRLIGQDATTYTLATVGAPSVTLRAQLQAAGEAGDFKVEILATDDADSAEQAVRDGDAEVALVLGQPTSTLFVDSLRAGPLPAIVSQAVVTESITQALADSGLSPSQIADIQQTPAPEQVPVGRAQDESRAGVGFGVGIVIYLALILAGTGVATAVATEKTTRVSEVLLTVLRPTQMLVGTVAGVGALGLIQVTALAVPVVLGLTTSGRFEIPPEASGDVLLGVVWFVLGMLEYAFVFAALAALVEKVSEVGTATIPVNVVLVGSYLVAVVVTAQDPSSVVSVIASLFPLSSPLVMPVRWATGFVPPWQLVLSMSLVVVASVVLARFAASVYALGIVSTGQRLRLRQLRTGRHQRSTAQ